MGEQNTDSNKAQQESGNDNKEPTQTNGQAAGWDGDFDADRARRLVENLREEVRKAKEDAAAAKSKLAEKEDSEKSELQKLMERAERAETELGKTKRSLLLAEVSKKTGVPVDLLSGDTVEEIEQKAQQLAEWAKKPADDLPKRPEAKLTPGDAGPADEGEIDIEAAVKDIRAIR